MSISVVSKCFQYLFTNLAMAVCVSVDLQQCFFFFFGGVYHFNKIVLHNGFGEVW